MPYTLSTSGEQFIEGDSYVFTVSRDDTSSSETISWSTRFYSNGEYPYYGADEADFSSETNGTITFPEGASEASIILTALDDSAIERNFETFLIGLDGLGVSTEAYLYDNDSHTLTMDVNSSVSFFTDNRDTVDVKANLESGVEYTANLAYLGGSNYGMASFAIYDDWGGEFEDYVSGFGHDYTFTPLTTGIYTFAVEGSIYAGQQEFSLSADYQSYAESHLEQFGVDLETAQTFLLSSLDQPEMIFEAAEFYSVTPAMLAGIVNVTVDQVHDFFDGQGFDANSLI